MGDEIYFWGFLCFCSVWLIGAGFLMRKFDFSGMFQTGDDGDFYLYVLGKRKKIARNTPENRVKYSKRLGNYFIGLSIFVLLLSLSKIIPLL